MIYAGVSLSRRCAATRPGQDVVDGLHAEALRSLWRVTYAARDVASVLRRGPTVTAEIHWPSGEAGLFLRNAGSS